MIAGLDSSFFRPSAATARAARAGGVTLWSGYLASRGGVGLASPWDRGSFENARQCGSKPIGFCSGWDDPVALKNLAAAWGVRLCLDVEGGGLRPDGNWIPGWLGASGAGLYGNYWVFQHGFRAAFYIVGGYPTRDPRATWGYVPRPDGPCGWQWMGSHDEFGGGVDRGWYDNWFARDTPPSPIEEESMHRVVKGDQKPACWKLEGGTKTWIRVLPQLTHLVNTSSTKTLEIWPQYVVDRIPRLEDVPEDLAGSGLSTYEDVAFRYRPPAAAGVRLTEQVAEGDLPAPADVAEFPY